MKVFVATLLSIVSLATLAEVIPVEPKAKLEGDDYTTAKEMARIVRTKGYPCDSISAYTFLSFYQRHFLSCNERELRYTIEYYGGKFHVSRGFLQ